MTTLPSPKGFKDEFPSVGSWAIKYGTATITNPTGVVGSSGRVLDIRFGQNAHNYVTPGRSATNLRMMLKMRQSTNAAPRAFGLAARIHGDSSNRNSYALRVGTNNNLLLLRWSGSSTFTVLADVPFNNVPLSWYWLDFMLEGNKLYGSAWFAGDPRPAGWMIMATDSTYAGAGEFGFQTQTNADSFQLDLFNTTLPQAA